MVGSRLKPQNQKKDVTIIDDVDGTVPQNNGETCTEETQEGGKTDSEEPLTQSDEEAGAGLYGDLDADGDSEM